MRTNKGVNVEKIIIDFKKLKLKKREEKKENSTELQKPNIEAEVYNNNIKRDWEKKKSQKLNWIS